MGRKYYYGVSESEDDDGGKGGITGYLRGAGKVWLAKRAVDFLQRGGGSITRGEENKEERRRIREVYYDRHVQRILRGKRIYRVDRLGRRVKSWYSHTRLLGELRDILMDNLEYEDERKAERDALLILTRWDELTDGGEKSIKDRRFR